MDVFYVVISCIFVVLLIAALVLWVIESRMVSTRKKLVAQKIDSGRGMRLESEDLYLKVQHGTVEICEGPAQAAAGQALAEAEEQPPVQPMSDEISAAYAPAETLAQAGTREEQLDELVSRYGEITEKSVVFESDKNEKKTFIEKYAELDSEHRGYYDDIVAYILAHPDCRKSETSSAVTFKCRTDKLMRAVIKRGCAVLNFMLFNNDLNRFVKEEGIKKIKINPVIIKLESGADLILAKQTVDITLENIHEEQQYRRERKREMRRRRAKESRESGTA